MPPLPLGLLLCAGFAGGAIAIHGWHGWLPDDVTWRMAPLAAIAALPAIAATARWRWFVPAAVAAVAVALPLLLKVSLREWTAGQAWLWLPLLGLGWLGLVLAARATAERLPDAALPAWAAALGVAGYVLADPAASATNGMFAAGIGLAAGLLGLARLLWPQRIAPGCAAAALAALVPMPLLLTHSLAYRGDTPLLPAGALALLALAPLAAWAARPLAGRRWTGAVAAALAAAAVAALALACLSPAPAPDPSGW